MEKVEEEADVLNVLGQVAPELVDILQRQPDTVQNQLIGLMRGAASAELRGVGNRRDCFSQLVEYFIHAERAQCRQFIHTVTMVCDNLPMALESQLMSAAGYDDSTTASLQESSKPENRYPLPSLESRTLFDDECPTQPKQKRPHKDAVEVFCTFLRSILVQRYQQVTHDIIQAMRLDEVRVGLRRSPTRLRDGAEDSVTDSVVSLDSLIVVRPGVTLLLGPAGSGKTLLAHSVAHRWAQHDVPRVRLLFLFEFRQLNLLSDSLLLSELLFPFLLSPSAEDREAILAFILAHPEQVYLIFDGYDEFHSQSPPMEISSAPFDPQQRLPLGELFVGLCSGRILPGCSLLVTCRARDMLYLPDDALSQVAELLGFQKSQIQEYAEHYFQGKGHSEQAMTHLLQSRQLLSLSNIPALCHICCLCVDHLFSSKGQLPPAVPVTVTQVYMHSLSASLRYHTGSRPAMSDAVLLHTHRLKIQELSRLALQGLDEGCVLFWTQDVSQSLLDFAAAARLVSFMKLQRGDGSWGTGCVFVHLTLQEFLAALYLMTTENVVESEIRKRLNLKTRWAARTQPKTVFTDSVQLYLCGLAAQACSSYLTQLAGPGAAAQVKQRQTVVLKVLKQLAGSSSLTGPKVLELCRCAYETQDAGLARMVGSRPRFELRNITLTPVDMEALVFAVSAGGQGVGLDFGGCSLELEGLEVLTSCQNISYLIFRSRKYEDKFADALSGILPKLPSLRKLEFTGGNLTDAGAAVLARALASCPWITELNLSDNIMSDLGLGHIADVLPKITSLSTVYLGKNNVSLDGVFTLLEEMTSCPTILKVHANGHKEAGDITLVFSQSLETHSGITGDNSGGHDEGRTVSLLNFIITSEKMDKLCQILTRCAGLSKIHLSGQVVMDDTLQVLCDWLQTLSASKQIVLNSSDLTMSGLSILSHLLAISPTVTEMNIRVLESTQVSITFDSDLQTLSQISGEKTAKSTTAPSKILRLSECSLNSQSMDQICETLRCCSSLTLLDLSHNKLGNHGLKKLLNLLPQLCNIQEINLGHNDVTMPGVLLLAEALCLCRNMSAVHISHGGKQKLLMKFHLSKSRRLEDSLAAGQSPENGLHVHKKFSLQHTEIRPANMSGLCKKLTKCSGLVLLDLTGSSLEEKSLLNLLRHLPQMATLKILNLSDNLLRDNGVKPFEQFDGGHQTSSVVSLNNNKLTLVGALHLVSAFATCQQVAAVEVRLRQEDQCVFRLMPDSNHGKYLRLRECISGKADLQMLARVLQNCHQLVHLDLSCNILTAESLEVLQKGLSCKLQSLEMRNCGLNKELIVNLLKGMDCIQKQLELRIEEPWITGEAAVSLITSCLNGTPSVQQIKVNGNTVNISLQTKHSHGELCTELSVTRADSGTQGPALKSIGLVNCSLRGQDLIFLHHIKDKCAQLVELDLSQNSIGTEGAEFMSSALRSLPNLRKLSLECKEAVLGEVQILVQNLSFSLSLEDLRLAHHVIDDIAASALARVLPTLTRFQAIDLSQCSGVTTVGAHDLFTGLSHCHFLKDIRLKGLMLPDEAVMCLATSLLGMTCVTRLILSKITIATGSDGTESGVMSSLLASLTQFQRMEVIELDEMRMGDSGVQDLIKHLPTWTKLRRISLCDNCISDGEGDRLLASLAQCTSLEEIM